MRPSKLRFVKESLVDIFIVRKIEMKTKVLEAESTTMCKLNRINKNFSENRNQAWGVCMGARFKLRLDHF